MGNTKRYEHKDYGVVYATQYENDVWFIAREIATISHSSITNAAECVRRNVSKENKRKIFYKDNKNEEDPFFGCWYKPTDHSSNKIIINVEGVREFLLYTNYTGFMGWIKEIADSFNESIEESSESIDLVVKSVDGKAMASSRDIATGLGKRHHDVMNQLSKIVKEQNENVRFDIIPNKYNDRGRLLDEYLLTKDGFILYMFNIQGYNDFKIAYINEFNEMEKAIRNTNKGLSLKDNLRLKLFSGDPLDVASAHKKLVELETAPLLETIEVQKDELNNKTESLKLANQNRSNLLKENYSLKSEIDDYDSKNKYLSMENDTLKEKATYCDMVLKSEGTLCIGQIAMEYGISARKMNQRLHKLGLQYQTNGQWKLYEKYRKDAYKYIDVTTIHYGENKTKNHTKWTQEGRLLIYNLLKNETLEDEKDRLIPLVERRNMEHGA